MRDAVRVWRMSRPRVPSKIDNGPAACPHCGVSQRSSGVRQGQRQYRWMCACPRRARPTFEERFWDKVERAAPDECWLWTGSRQPAGYGRINASSRRNCRTNAGAHVVSWELHHRATVVPGFFVCHQCDNPPCVNPAHLVVGTPADNLRGMVERGRSQRGERHCHAKFTADNVRYIRRVCGPGAPRGTQQRLAERYGVWHGAISKIVLRKRWEHIA